MNVPKAINFVFCWSFFRMGVNFIPSISKLNVYLLFIRPTLCEYFGDVGILFLHKVCTYAPNYLNFCTEANS